MLGKATSNTNCVMHCESFVAHGDAAPSCFGGLWPSTWWGNGATLNKGPGVGNEFRHPNGAPRSMEIWFLVSFALGLKRQCQTHCKTTTFVASWTKPRWRVSAVHTQHNIWTFEPAYYITALIDVGSYDPGVPWCITTLNVCIQLWKNQGLRTWGRLQPEAWQHGHKMFPANKKWHWTTAMARPPGTVL